MADSPASDRIPLRFALPVAWVAGAVSALGAELVGLALAETSSAGATLAAVRIGLALGIWVLTDAAALAMLYYGLYRLSPLPQYPVRSGLLTLLLGTAGVVALSNAVTPGGVRPAFGSLTMLLLTVPYPLAYLLVAARSRRTMLVTAGLALVLGAVAVPLRNAQEHLVARSWLSAHPGIGRPLLRTVDWSGTSADQNLESGSYGIRSTVRYGGDDSDQGGIVTVSPVGTDPCLALAEFVTDEGGGIAPSGPIGSITTRRPNVCAPGPNQSWTLKQGDWAGYAVRRDGVLLTLSFCSPGNSPDLAAVARTLRPLDDAALWPYLQPGSGVFRLLL